MLSSLGDLAFRVFQFFLSLPFISMQHWSSGAGYSFGFQSIKEEGLTRASKLCLSLPCWEILSPTLWEPPVQPASLLSRFTPIPPILGKELAVWGTPYSTYVKADWVPHPSCRSKTPQWSLESPFLTSSLGILKGSLLWDHFPFTLPSGISVLYP